MTPSNSRVVRGPKVGYLREDADHGGDGGGRRRDARLGPVGFLSLCPPRLRFPRRWPLGDMPPVTW
jgi:hypothetical protein